NTGCPRRRRSIAMRKRAPASFTSSVNLIRISGSSGTQNLVPETLQARHRIDRVLKAPIWPHIPSRRYLVFGVSRNWPSVAPSPHLGGQNASLNMTMFDDPSQSHRTEHLVE